MRALCAGDIASYHVTMGEAAMLYERGGDLRNACNAECNLGFCRAELGVWDDAEAVLRCASLARARRLGLISVEYNALHNLGYVLFRLGRVEEARARSRATAPASSKRKATAEQQAVRACTSR